VGFLKGAVGVPWHELTRRLMTMFNKDGLSLICSYLEKKLALFNHYLSITKKLKENLESKQENHLDSLLSERGRCIKRIQMVDFSMEKLLGGGRESSLLLSDRLRLLISSYASRIKNTMERILFLDKEMLALAEAEETNIRAKLLKLQNARRAIKSYCAREAGPPRFLDNSR